MIVCNIMFKMRASRLITYESGGAVSQIDYFLTRKKNRRFIRDVKEEECALQHKLMVCNILLKRCSEKKRVFMFRRKVWKLKNPIEKEYLL